jgi:peptidyl-prolyl cis-trans isomerase SurA
MNKILVFFLVAYTSCVFSNNTIIALVNNTPITLNLSQINLSEANTRDEQILIINNSIDNILQVQKATELDLTPTKRDLENVLNDIAQNNNHSLDELRILEDFYFIEKEVFEKLSILNLQRFITKDLMVSEEQILKACSDLISIKDQKQIKIAQIIISEIGNKNNDLDKKNILIKDFLNKLTSHIKKGASFEAFAKLHSQHPSYYNGGITEWLRVEGSTLEMLDSLSNKEVSEIYMTDFGLAIAIKVDERYISSKLKDCEEKLVYRNAESYYSSWLTTLRNQAKIEIYYDKLL